MKIVFLDIDGVLQPYDSEYRFYEIDKKAKRIVYDLSEKYDVDYEQYSIYDILAVYYDWNMEAILRLKKVLDETNSKIIISSDWKSERFPHKMRDLLKIHDLDKYWYCDNTIIRKILPMAEIRHLEIEDSLKKYPIDNFVVLDDLKKLGDYYPNNSVITYDYMSINNMNDCIKILKKTR